MSLFHELVPFTQITRHGMPQFRVSRRPMTIAGQELPVGAVFPVTEVPNWVRLKQLYEQRAIAVVPGSVVMGPGVSERMLDNQIKQDEIMMGTRKQGMEASTASTANTAAASVAASAALSVATAVLDIDEEDDADTDTDTGDDPDEDLLGLDLPVIDAPVVDNTAAAVKSVQPPIQPVPTPTPAHFHNQGSGTGKNSRNRR